MLIKLSTAVDKTVDTVKIAKSYPQTTYVP